MRERLFKKVLVIEEQATARSQFFKALENKGFETVATENGHFGIQLAQEHLPDLIVCSVEISDPDGFTVLEALRQDSRTATIPLIFLTVDLAMSELHKAMMLGASGYLSKRCTLEELSQTVAAQLESRCRLHHYYTAQFQLPTQPANQASNQLPGQLSNQQPKQQPEQQPEPQHRPEHSWLPAYPLSPLSRPIATYDFPLDEALRFIVANYHQPIALIDVAQAVGYSPAYLTSLMGQQTGQTVQQWIIQHRMAAACSLLLKTNRPIEQIATQVGYQNAVHFFRHFRRFYGTTPKVWRNNCG